MQASNDKEKKQPEGEQTAQPQAELSEAWRALLGLLPAGEVNSKTEAEPVIQVQPLASDPWNNLLHAQGMQPVDLERMRLRDLTRSLDDNDIEHALNVMREATGQLPIVKKTGEP